MQPTFERRVSEWVEHYNMQIKSLDDRPDNPDPDGDVVYVIKDVFTTYQWILGTVRRARFRAAMGT